MSSQQPDHVTESMKKDLWLIVGGDFSPDSVGPERYNATVARVRARASQYLSLLESLFLGSNFDANMQSTLYLPSFLQLVADVEPERVSQLAEQLLGQIDGVAIRQERAMDIEPLSAPVSEEPMSEEVINTARRLDQRRAQLQNLTK